MWSAFKKENSATKKMGETKQVNKNLWAQKNIAISAHYFIQKKLKWVLNGKNFRFFCC
jgi:hypothetical protein